MRNNRPEVEVCYGHIKGELAEQLMHWLLDKGWVTVEWHEGMPHEAALTPEGREGLAAWGVEVSRLDQSERKPVAVCTERLRGESHDHLGAHLGTLLREWLERENLIETYEGGLRLTDAGRLGFPATTLGEV
ncbi:hypothetical protein J7643_02820 [bacterium]|nr:hypothetical protein [bacterium]